MKNLKGLAGKVNDDNSKTKDNLEGILNTQAVLDHTFDNFDNKLSHVLKKHEHEYMLAYNYYVKKKEMEIKSTIHELSMNSNSEAKDIRI